MISKKDIRSFISFLLGGVVFLLLPVFTSESELVSKYGNVFSFLGLSYLFSSFSFLFNHLELKKREKASRIILASGIGIILLGSLIKLCKIEGANFVVIAGFSLVAFTYATILSTIRKEKWQGYAQKKWQILLLRFGDISGIGLLVSGVLGKYLGWNFSEIFLVIGVVLLVASMMVWNKLFRTEVLLRKQAEAQLQQAFDELKNQHQVIEEKNKEIMDSLYYAKRIQSALLPRDNYISRYFKGTRNG